MSDVAQPGAGTNASAPQKVVIEVAQPQHQASGTDFQRMTPEQFNARLAEAEESGVKRFLKSFGIKKEDRAEVLAAINSGKYMLKPAPAEGEPDYKAEYEKLKPLADKLPTLESELKEAHGILKTGFEERFSKLPEPVRKYIEASTPKDDWRAQQKALVTLEQSGMLAAITAQGAGQQQTKENREAKPATTMAPSGPQGTNGNAKTAYEQYQEILKSGNRILAAQFRLQHGKAIEASQPK